MFPDAIEPVEEGEGKPPHGSIESRKLRAREHHKSMPDNVAGSKAGIRPPKNRATFRGRVRERAHPTPTRRRCRTTRTATRRASGPASMWTTSLTPRQAEGESTDGKEYGPGSLGVNLRNVWKIPTYAYPDAHFATFPPKLVEPCIKAGTSEHGCCAECGAPWRRKMDVAYTDGTPNGPEKDEMGMRGYTVRMEKYTTTVGWEPGCECGAEVVPCRVLDPFGGSGTTALVADRLGRDATLVEINPKYADQAVERIRGDAGLFSNVEKVE